jgi:5'-nucleotidase / UDP-sugar diphosphatase
MEVMKRIVTASTIFLCFLFTFAASAKAAGPAPDIVILFTHDLHSYLQPIGVPGKNGVPVFEGGYARLAYAIKAQRAKYGGRTILVDGGDFAEGTLFHTVLPDEALEFTIMGMIGYDTTTLGNHDFDFCPSGLARMLRTARKKRDAVPALVASNVVFSGEAGDSDLKKAFAEYPVKEYLVIIRNGLRIGLFGMMGKDAATDASYATPVTFADQLDTARRMVRVLREKERVDLVICLSHSGTWAKKSVSEDEILAKKVEGIDVIISGHTHKVLLAPIIINKTFIVSAGCYSAYLGALGLSRSGAAGYSVVSYELVHITGDLPQDTAVAARISEFENIVEQRYLSHFNYRFNQAIARSGFDLETVEYLYAHPGETRLGDLITDGYRYAVRKAEGPAYRYVHAAIDPLGTIRSSFVRGRITVADTFRVLSMGPGDDGYSGNTLIAAYLTGSDLKNVMEIHPSIGPLKDDAFLQVSGVRFKYNPHRVIFDRVYEMEVQDEKGAYLPLEKEKLYRIVINSFIANMFDYLREKSMGLLSIQFRDRNGARVSEKDLGSLSVRENANGRKVKEWVSLAWYLQSFRDANGKGIPDIPDRYRNTDARIVATYSWSPVAIFGSGKPVTYAVLGLIILFTAGFVFATNAIVKKVRKQKEAGLK